MNIKWILSLTTILLILNCSTSSEKKVNKGKVRILVMDEIKAAKIIREELSKSNLFEVITVEDQKKALSRMKDCNTSNCALELGKILFARYIFQGSLNNSILSFRIIDLDKGLYSASLIKHIETKEELGKSINNAVPELVNNFSEREHIIDIEKSRVLFNNCNIFEETMNDSFRIKESSEIYKISANQALDFLRNAFINKKTLAVIDELVIEKTLKKISLKQACGSEDCEIQLAKILFADYILSCSLHSQNLRSYTSEDFEFPVVNVKIYNVKKGKYLKPAHFDVYENYLNYEKNSKVDLMKVSQKRNEKMIKFIEQIEAE
jgi:hypothetical protein